MTVETAREIPSRYAAFLHAKLSAALDDIDRDMQDAGHIAPFMVDERKEGAMLVLVLDASQIPVVGQDERARVLNEARALEEADGYWEPLHLAAILGCHKSSLYRDLPLMNLKEETPGGARWRPSRVRGLLALRSKSLTANSRTTKWKVG